MFDEDRARQIGSLLTSVLRDGDRFAVSKADGRVEVTPLDPAKRAPLRETNPALYGHLLEASTRLCEAGRNYLLIAILGAVGLCVAIHLEWVERLGRLDLAKARSVWAYLFFCAAAFLGSVLVVVAVERSVYRRLRSSLLLAIRRAGLTRRLVLARIEGDPTLKDVADKLKTDTDDTDEASP